MSTSRSTFATVLLISGLAGSLLLSAPALACKCMFPPVETARDDATAVFEGRVVSVEQAPGSDATNGERRVTLRVVRTWKGLERDERITIFTNGSSAACGYTFAQATSYLVYARSSDDQKLHVNSCSRTKSLADASEDLAFLGAGSTPVAIEKSTPTLDASVSISTTSAVDGGTGNLPPPVPANTTPTAAAKKKGCAIGTSDQADDTSWLLALPALALFWRRRSLSRLAARKE